MPYPISDMGEGSWYYINMSSFQASRHEALWTQNIQYIHGLSKLLQMVLEPIIYSGVRPILFDLV